MQGKCNLNIDFFQINLDLFFLSNCSECKIYGKGFFIEYCFGKEYYKKIYCDNSCFYNFNNDSIFQTVEEINTLDQLNNLVCNYDFISYDDDGLEGFLSLGGMIYKKYIDSLEGGRWKRIFEVKSGKIIDINILRELEINCAVKKWSNFVFPYVDNKYIEWLNWPLDKIYQFFFNEIPSIIPDGLEDMENYVYIEYKYREKKRISKFLSDKFKILYIGDNPIFGVDKAIIYKAKSYKDTVFNSLQLNMCNDCLIKYAKDLDFIYIENNLYLIILDFLKKDILNFLKGEGYGNWYYFLEVTSELAKLLFKIKRIFNNCIRVIKDYDLNIILVNGYADFFDIEKKIAVSLMIQTATISFPKHIIEQIKKHEIRKYIVITSEKIEEVDLELLREKSLNKVSIYRDLFYWNIIDY